MSDNNFLGNGQFEYINDVWTREMLINAWQAINLTELWDFVKQDIDSFMFSHDPRVTRIYNKMEELGYGGHSGASFGFTMRNMQYLAEHGEEKFKTEILKTR
jgi:nanoRNase/pAp phosphatase (c-di-AMP/oligoRNAs hydrolase)